MANFTKIISKQSTRYKDRKKAFNKKINAKIRIAERKGKTFKVAKLEHNKLAKNIYFDKIISAYIEIENALVPVVTSTPKKSTKAK